MDLVVGGVAKTGKNGRGEHWDQHGGDQRKEDQSVPRAPGSDTSQEKLQQTLWHLSKLRSTEVFATV